MIKAAGKYPYAPQRQRTYGVNVLLTANTQSVKVVCESRQDT